ncbi:MAG TPA: histidinol-phosphate transaminase [Firmicutes bacterium]|nr:histidinol-phosphate transaminase [Bacillota bacterium]
MSQRLCREKILAIKPYVPGKPVEEVERELGIKNVIKLASNENPLGPSPKAEAAIRKLAATVSLYPDGNCYYLKETLARRFNVGTDQLFIGNGSDEIIEIIAKAFLEEGEEAVVADPTFSEYDFAVTLMGGVTVAVPLKKLTHDLRAMADAVTENTKLFFICNPNNPTGTMVDKKAVAELMQRLPERVITVFDEAYHEYVTDPAYPRTLDYVRAGRNVIILRTFSKIYGLAGLRVGYALSTPEIIGMLNRVKEPFNVNLLAQAAALAALEDTEHLERSVRVNEEGKAYLYEEFDRLGLAYEPTRANFIWVQVKADSQKVFQKLLHLGVIVRTGDIFGAPDVLRVTVGTPEQNRRFIAALRSVLTTEGVLG